MCLLGTPVIFIRAPGNYFELKRVCVRQKINMLYKQLTAFVTVLILVFSQNIVSLLGVHDTFVSSADCT